MSASGGLREFRVERDIGRPILAFLAASTTASLLLVGILLFVWPALDWLARRPAGAPIVELTLRELGAVGFGFFLYWFYGFLATALVAAAPVAAAAWIGHVTAAPRPLAEILFGGAVGVLVMAVIASIPLPDVYTGWPISTLLAYALLFAACGALGGWVYARVAGPRA